MKRRSPYSLTVRTIAWVVLIQVANLCIDSVDPIYDRWEQIPQGEDLRINDLESIYEFISEELLNIEVPENDEDDENGLLKGTDYLLADSSFELNNEFRVLQVSFSRIDLSFHAIILEHNAPPPKKA